MSESRPCPRVEARTFAIISPIADLAGAISGWGRQRQSAPVSLKSATVSRSIDRDGNVLTPTLHGNILTSVCTAQGEILDALPGIYEPKGYLDQLNQLRLLAQNFQQQFRAMQESGTSLGPVERFVYSLVLANHKPAHTEKHIAPRDPRT